MAEEIGYLLIVNRKNFKFKRVKISGKNFKFRKKRGVEGLAKIDKNRYAVAIQSKNRKSAKLLIVKLKNGRAKIEKIINHKIVDSAGLEYKNGKLFIVSDKKDKLYIYDLKSEKILQKVDLPKFAQEGVTLGEKDSIYFADDDGGLFKYSQKELGLVF